MGSAWIYTLEKKVITYFFLLLVCKSNQEIICPFQSIYQFGDSTSDTGNLIRVGNIGPLLPVSHLPYGETFPGRPTGRWSDGLLIIDFIAVSLRLPLLNPYLDRNASFKYGVNFAVAGSTALDIPFLAARGVRVPNFTAPLSLQLNWFKSYLNSICSNAPECQNKLKRALFLVGDIGNNDVNYALAQGRSLQEIFAFVPFIAESIANGTTEAIGLGATRLVVPGTFPLGCFPLYLSSFPDGELDNWGCLRSLNELSIFFNNKVQASLESLRREFPNVVIVYADYYNAFLSVLRRVPILGFDPTSLLKACCGNGSGIFANDTSKTCGSPGVPACPNPARYLHWDGIHLTQEAHRRISEVLIPDILLKIQCFQ